MESVKKDRRFGLLISLVLLIFFGFSYLKGHHRYWTLPMSAITFISAILFPVVLKPFHWLWNKLGLVLHHITSPLLLVLCYYLAFLPMGLIIRLSGKDLLKTKHTPAVSYWIEREPPGPTPGSLINQF